jgi:1-aminocyclopropane-1-carboxylate deaminase
LHDFSPQSLSGYAQRVGFQRLVWPALDHKNLSVYLRRDDLASDHYPGNKFYKLFYNLQDVLATNHRTVLSFGGAYSNHIHALATMGQEYALSTIGVIRGHRPKVLSPTLRDAEACGMRLLFLDRQYYQEKDLTPLLPIIQKDYGDFYCLPEGGENMAGVRGCQAIGEAIAAHFTGDYTVCSAVGTGTTLAGIIAGLPQDTLCLGVSVLKGEDRLSASISTWLEVLGCEHENWQIINGFHHGGYAKTTPELLAFMAQLEADNDLLLEPVYSAKMLWAIEQLAMQGFWSEGAKIIAVHGGGIQGRRGFTL